MEERQLKRLLIIVAVSIAIIMAFKMMLTDSLTTMNQTAAKKKLATPAPPQPAIEPPVMLEPVLFPPEPVEAPAKLEEPALPQTEVTGVPDATVGDEPAVMGDEDKKMDGSASSNVSTDQ